MSKTTMTSNLELELLTLWFGSCASIILLFLFMGAACKLWAALHRDDRLVVHETNNNRLPLAASEAGNNAIQ
jgi:hypothetical protein